MSTPDANVEFPDQTGKVVIVTGGTSGIGRETCKFFLEKGARVYVGARSREKAEQVIRELINETKKDNIHLLPINLSDLHSVKEASDYFKSQERDLHLLYNNAGIMGTPFALTPDGYEEQFGTNVVGHFALTKLLLPVLEKTAAENPPGTVRIINTSSKAHDMTPPDGIHLEDITLQNSGLWFLEWKRYGQSKLGNILLSNELARRYADKGIYSLSLHPGIVDTPLMTSHSFAKTWFGNLLSRAFSNVGITPKQGAYTQIYAGVSKDVIDKNLNGAYLIPYGQVGAPTKHIKDVELAKRMWDYLDHEVEIKLQSKL
eukprot:TRINITY_DN2741_c0_g1_i1.p1 TRINITY_DN2741_c0_g1~~TRINITY_DN2741_c0_g1_i1.p1  ORF type:complete len:340 (-),score=80.20 TRINITY_DN2741_c0_g1_i1:423-1370(-)